MTDDIQKPKKQLQKATDMSDMLGDYDSLMDDELDELLSDDYRESPEPPSDELRESGESREPTASLARHQLKKVSDISEHLLDDEEELNAFIEGRESLLEDEFSAEEDFDAFLSSGAQTEYLEGRVEGEGLSFDFMKPEPRVAPPVDLRRPPRQKKEKNFSKNKPAVPISIPDKQFYQGALPEDRRPVVVGTVQELNKSVSAGLVDETFTEEDREWAKSYRKRTSKKYSEKEGLGPLDNALAMETIVTPDGKTLSEVLAIGRSSTKIAKDQSLSYYYGELLKKAKKQLLEEEDYDDDRYIQYLKKGLVKATKEEEKKTRKYEELYRKGQSEYTPAERKLGHLLGVSVSDLSKLMGPKSDLTEKEKRELIGYGQWRRKSKVDQKVIETSFVDRDILSFLSRFKVAPAHILSNIHGKELDVTIGILERMKGDGLVMDYPFPGLGVIWGLTLTGAALTNSPIGHTTQRTLPRLGGMPPLLAANHAASYLWNNRVNVLNLRDFPYHGRYVNKTYIRGEELISETMMRKSLFQAMLDDTGAIPKTSYAGENVERVRVHGEDLWRDWEMDGGESPDTIPGNEFLFILFPQHALTKMYHIPDLVILRERGEDGKPQSIAVEMEQREASLDVYAQTHLAYKLDDRVYGKVIWITNTTSNARKIRDGAKQVNFDRFDVVPLMDERGVIRPYNFWHL